MKNTYSRLISVVSVASEESPLGHGIYLTEEVPKWAWAACHEEARGERGLAFSGQVLAASSVKQCQTLLIAMLIPKQ